MNVAIRSRYDKRRRLALLMIAYLFFSFSLLPLLAPLRNLGVMEPALVRNALLPFIFIALIFSVGFRNIINPKSGIQVLFLVMIFQASLLGLGRLFEEGGMRSYFSHIFQISSAYLMICVGWLLFDYWSERFWARISLISIFSALVSSFIVIDALGRGDVGRYYTAAYGFILVSAFSAVASNKMQIISLLGGLISNKRAVLLAILSIIAVSFVKFGGDREITPKKVFVFLGVSLFGVFGVLLFIYFLVGWAEENESSALGRAVNTSTARIEQVIDLKNSEKTLDEISSGRLQEIEVALNSLSGMDMVIGSGAGWRITLYDQKSIQNIHFTPVSILAVYGLPYTVLFYSFLIFYLARSFFLKANVISTTGKIAPYYVLGALVHSFFAYSLFIDWMFFFFVGVLVRSASIQRSKRHTVEGK